MVNSEKNNPAGEWLPIGALFRKKYLPRRIVDIEFRLIRANAVAMPSNGRVTSGTPSWRVLNPKGKTCARIFELCKPSQFREKPARIRWQPVMRITVQGGMDCNENEFSQSIILWMVPGGQPIFIGAGGNYLTTDLNKLATATKDDYYVTMHRHWAFLFNNFKKSTAQYQREHRIEKEAR